MKPSQLARSLKRIASGIEASKKPKKELVIRDLKRILAAMDEEKISGYSLDQIHSEIIRGLEHIKGSEEWLTSGNDIIIRPDSTSGTILAILSEADKEGNVIEITIPFKLVADPIIKETKG